MKTVTLSNRFYYRGLAEKDASSYTTDQLLTVDGGWTTI